VQINHHYYSTGSL